MCISIYTGHFGFVCKAVPTPKYRHVNSKTGKSLTVVIFGILIFVTESSQWLHCASMQDRQLYSKSVCENGFFPTLCTKISKDSTLTPYNLLLLLFTETKNMFTMCVRKVKSTMGNKDVCRCCEFSPTQVFWANVHFESCLQLTMLKAVGELHQALLIINDANVVFKVVFQTDGRIHLLNRQIDGRLHLEGAWFALLYHPQCLSQKMLCVVKWVRQVFFGV